MIAVGQIKRAGINIQPCVNPISYEKPESKLEAATILFKA